MKIKLLCCLLALLFALPVAAEAPKGKPGSSYSATIDNSNFIDANRVLMFITNHGNFGRDLSGVFGYDYGTFFPYSGNPDDIAGNVNSAGDKSPIFAAGLWMGGIVDGNIRVAISEFDSEYGPGNMVGGTFAVDGPEFQVFKLYRDSLKLNPNDDYKAYMTDGVAQGAPTVLDGAGDLVPDMIGDQMLWSVYNDADPVKHQNDAGLTLPLGLEIQQTFFAFNRQGSLGNMTFVKYKILNKGGNNIDSMFISLWCDPDLGNAADDLVGSDSLTSLGYVYNASPTDNQYPNVAPPAMGFDFFQGPMLITNDIADTALMWGYAWPNRTNLPMSSFNKYINGTEPLNFVQTFDYMKGLNGREDGIPYVYDGDTLLFMHSGDPVTGDGDLDNTPNDRRFMLTTGPFTFAAGDSTEIIAAIVFGQGGDYLNSITVLKSLDDFAQRLYDGKLGDVPMTVDGVEVVEHFSFLPPDPPAPPNVTVTRLSSEIALSWDDTSEVDQGDYLFEGYTVWQSESPSGPWEILQIWDVDNDNTDALIDSVPDNNSGLLLPIVQRKIVNSGISYLYKTKVDAIGGGDLDDMTPYFFRVTAFSFAIHGEDKVLFTDTAGNEIPVGDRFLESETKVSIIPQAPLAGTNLNSTTESQIPVTHDAGISDGVVTVQVVDPHAITGDSYEVTFGLDTSVIFSEDTTVYFTETILPDTCDVFFDTVLGWLAVNCIDTVIDSTIIDNPSYDTTETVFWNFENTTTNTMLLERQFNLSNDDSYIPTEGFLVKVAGPAPGFVSFQVSANASGPLDPVESGALDFQGFPVPDGTGPTPGRPSDAQQVGEGHWGFHTGDNGGTSGGGTRGSFDAFLSRTFRGDQARIDRLGVYDWEMRFTGSNDNPGVNGGYALAAFTSGVAFWVPFELWRTGIGTPDDPSDDLRLIPWIFDDGGDSLYYMSAYGSATVDNCGPGGCEHSASGADNDPYTDWVYWKIPVDDAGTPYTSGSAGYDVFVDSIMVDPTMPNWQYIELAVMDRTVLINWNGGVQPPFNQDLPEQGTVFRLVTAKPNTESDVFSFSTAGFNPTFTSSEFDLDNITTVPNPFYLNGPYDPSPGQYNLKFHNLPAECTIDIYNLAGEHVIKIDKNDASTNEASWNLLTTNRLPVSSGIYIYVVNAPGFGQKIGKTAIFTEQEVLRIF